MQTAGFGKCKAGGGEVYVLHHEATDHTMEEHFWWHGSLDQGVGGSIRKECLKRPKTDRETRKGCSTESVSKSYLLSLLSTMLGRHTISECWEPGPHWEQESYGAIRFS